MIKVGRNKEKKRKGEKKVMKKVHNRYMMSSEKGKKERENNRGCYIYATHFTLRVKENNKKQAKKYRENRSIADKIGGKTGDKLVDLLHKSDAWGDKDCGRSDCFPCNSSGENEPKGS